MINNTLDKLFKPKSVAVIGASNRETAVGSVVMRNLISGDFKGDIFPVNPKGEIIHGIQSFKSINDLPYAPDLAILTIKPEFCPESIEMLAAKGNKFAIVIAAGLEGRNEGDELSWQERCLNTAKANGMRIIGPNCLGILSPHYNLNGSFSCSPALKGRIAFLSQSGALCVSVLDWAKPQGIGFSKFISIGNTADLDFDDLLAYVADDEDTNAIFMYIESVKHKEKFMQAALAASKKKPVFAIKSGRVPEGAAAAASHTGALAGKDNVYDAAFERAGIIRLEDLEDMYSAIQFLEYRNSVKDENVTILTNGGGPGVLAVDSLIKAGGHLTKLSDETKKKLDEVLPSTWSHSNPVDIIGDAPGDRYAAALKVLLEAPEVGEILAMYVPTGITSGAEVAEKVLQVEAEHKSGRIFGCWVGGEVVAPGIKMFNEQAKLPCFVSGERGVKGFMYLCDFYNLRKKRDEIDGIPAKVLPCDKDTVRSVFDKVFERGATTLTEVEAKRVFEAYNIPVVATKIAKTPDEAKKLADKMQMPVALKILSDDISHKSDAGGVILNIGSADDVKNEAKNMLNRIKKNFPQARIDGFTVQQMVKLHNPHEIIVGVSSDNIFGRTLMVGQGGTAVEIIKDTAIAMTPLNKEQAMDAIKSTKVYNLLKGYRDRPAANIDGLAQTMVQISQLVSDFPELKELDANPMFVDENSVIAVDARIVIKK